MKNLNVAVREWQDEVVFLHKIVEGAADKSYGIHVARLAGVPREVVERGKEILAQLEEEHLDAEGRAKIARPQPGRNAARAATDALRKGEGGGRKGEGGRKAIRRRAEEQKDRRREPCRLLPPSPSALRLISRR